MKDFPQFGGVRILCDFMGQSEWFTGVFTQVEEEALFW